MKFKTILTDLDEILFQVRDKKSRLYIEEAINAYKGGAFRTAIVSTWIAVTYDIISKIREIANQGDGKASEFIKKLDGYISNTKSESHIDKFKNIEKDLLENALKDYEFINKHEYTQLLRLKDDRNFCAHPAFYDNDTLYSPTPELARMHIVQAVTALLRHPPIHGKSALNKIDEEINKLSFPKDKEKIYELIHERYLDRAKDVFIKNLIDLIVKRIFNFACHQHIDEEKLINVLSAIQRSKPMLYEKYIKDIIDKNIRRCNDKQLEMIVFILHENPSLWYFFEKSDKIQIEEIVKQLILCNNAYDLSRLQIHAYGLVSKINDIKDIIASNFNSLDKPVQFYILLYNKLPEYKNEAVELYKIANSYRNAECIGKIIMPMIPVLSQENIQSIIEILKKNNQVRSAAGTPAIIEELFDCTYEKYPDLKKLWQVFLDKLKDNSDYYLYKNLCRKFEEKCIQEKTM